MPSASEMRADHVGSFLRPSELLEAHRNSENNSAQLRALEDKHIRDVLNRQRDLGFQIFTDGELRRRNFMSDFTDAVEGFDTEWRDCENVASRAGEKSAGQQCFPES